MTRELNLTDAVVVIRDPPFQIASFCRPQPASRRLIVAPTIGFKLLYGFVIIRLDRRDPVWINLTTNPTAEWLRVKARWKLGGGAAFRSLRRVTSSRGHGGEILLNRCVRRQVPAA